MYSLTIHFGPNAMCWALLFKEEVKAESIYDAYMDFQVSDATKGMLIGSDDFGQAFAIPMDQIRGIMLENMDLVMEARILRSLESARGEVKAKQRAMTDPVIRAGQTMQPGVIAPSFGRN
jgi:hypothetical protein